MWGLGFASITGLLHTGVVSPPSREHFCARKTSGWTWVQRHEQLWRDLTLSVHVPCLGRAQSDHGGKIRQSGNQPWPQKAGFSAALAQLGALLVLGNIFLFMPPHPPALQGVEGWVVLNG